MKKLIIILLSFVYFANLFSQRDIGCSYDDLSVEAIVVLHTDRDRYIVGENLWFKAYCIEDMILKSDFSKVLYVELYDGKGISIVKRKFLLSKGIAVGDFSIPKTIYSGNYFLRAYTNYQRNFSVDNIYTQMVSILNPYISESEILNTEYVIDTLAKEVVLINKENEIEDINLNIGLNKKQFNKREKIILSLETTELDSIDISISVVKKGYAFNNKELSEIITANSWLKYSQLFQYNRVYREFILNKGIGAKNIDELAFIPEIRGVSLSGIARNSISKTPLSNRTYLLTVVGGTPQIHVSKTDSKGRFIFSFNDLYEKQKLYIGSFNQIGDDSLELLVNSDFDYRFPEIKTIPLTFNKKNNDIFNSMFINIQLRTLYDVDKHLMTNSQPNNYVPINLKNPDFVVNVKEFIDLPDIESVFREIIPGVSIYGKGGHRYLSLFNRKKGLLFKRPLILLDNVMVSNVDRLLLINPSIVERIEVISSRYYLGDFSIDGIISIKTQTENFASYEWDDNSVFVLFNYYSKNHIFNNTITNFQNKSIPYVRNTLFWKPSLRFRSRKDISFISSDEKGIFEVVVKGFSISGKPYYGKVEFIVK